MRKLNLANYSLERIAADDTEFTQTYEVRRSLITMLMHQDLKLNGMELLDRDALGHKIKGCTEDVVLLEEAEWGKLNQAVNKLTGFNGDDMELIKRIIKAEVVEVAEKT